AAVARRGARRVLRAAPGQRRGEPAAPGDAPPRAVPARPRSTGATRPGAADGEAGGPRGAGVGPPDAPQQSGGACRALLLSPVPADQPASRPAAAAAARSPPRPGAGAGRPPRTDRIPTTATAAAVVISCQFSVISQNTRADRVRLTGIAFRSVWL